MKKTKEQTAEQKINSYFKHLKDEVKSLSYCVNHFDFVTFLKDCNKGNIGGNDYLLIEVLKKENRFAFLSYCINLEQFYNCPNKIGYEITDKSKFSLLKLADLLKTLIVLSEQESTIKVRTGSETKTDESGKEKTVPVYSQKTQIGIINLLELFAKSTEVVLQTAAAKVKVK